MRSITVIAVTVLAGAPGSAEPLDVAVSGNIGFAAPAGVASLMARIDIAPMVLVEGDAGWSTGGAELGGGVGISLMTERAKTAKLGWATARWILSALVTRSRTDEREAGIHGGPLPELVQGAGTYYWGYIMTGGELRLDSHLYILGEVGGVVRLARRAVYAMDPAPDDMASLNIRAGVGAHF